MNTIPNLDALSASTLWDLWSDYRYANRATCRELIGDTRPGYTRIVHSDLACYCANKGTAMRVRTRGDIPTALMYEQIADRIYASLPADLKW